MKKLKLQNNSVTKNVIVTLLCAVLLKGLSIILSPIVTRFLLPSEYAMVSNYNIWLSVLCVIIGFEVQGAINNSLIDYKEKRNQFTSNCLFIGFICAVVLAVPMIIFREWIGSLLDLKPILVCILVPHAFCSFVIAFISNRYVAERKPILNFIICFVVSVLGASLSLLLLIGADLGSLGYILGTTIICLAIGLTLFVISLVKGKSILDREIWKYALIIGVPLVLHNLISIVLSSSDKLMIKYILGDHEMGIYAFSSSICSILTIIWSAVNSGTVPFYYISLEKNDHQAIRKTINNVNIFFTIMCTGFLMVFKEFFILIYPSTYNKSIPIVGFLVLSVYFTSMYSYPVNYEFYHKKTGWIACGTVLAGITNIALNLLFINIFGINGAAIATCIAYFVLFIGHEIIVRFVIKDYPVKWYSYLPCLFVMLCVVGIFYLTLNLWYIRWAIAVLAGTILLVRIVKMKKLF